jgi:PII-like signaling protein
LSDKIERNEMGGAYTTYGKRKGVYRVLVGKREEQRPLGRPKHRCERNIKMGLQDAVVSGICSYGVSIRSSDSIFNLVTLSSMNLPIILCCMDCVDDVR